MFAVLEVLPTTADQTKSKFKVQNKMEMARARAEVRPENTDSQFILPSLRTPENEEESSPQKYSSLDEHNLTFTGKSSRSNTARANDEQIQNIHTAEANTNSEIMTSHSSVRTQGSGNIFQSTSVFSIPEESSILNVPSENFNEATTSSATITGQLMETQENVNEHSECGLDDEESTLKISDKPNKKRRGGWPKGKKRRKEGIGSSKPKAPMAGHIRFINSRRPAVRSQHPNLASIQIIKLIGSEWNAMPPTEKQVYHDEAEEDKKRYLEELVAYQQSEAYQAFLKRQQSKKLKDLGVENLEELDPNFMPTRDYDEVQVEVSAELYCKVCNQHFSSEHNKKEHMLGRQHLQMVTGEFEKEVHTNTKTRPTVPGQVENVEKPRSDHEDESQMSEGAKPTTLSDVMETLLQHNYDREMEIRELRKNLSDYENQRMLLSKELDRLKKRVFDAEESLNESKSFGSTLSNQLEDLRLVPSLFGVIL